MTRRTMVRASAAAVFRGLLPGAAAAAATPAVLHPESYRHYIDAFNAGDGSSLWTRMASTRPGVQRRRSGGIRSSRWRTKAMSASGTVQAGCGCWRTANRWACADLHLHLHLHLVLTASLPLCLARTWGECCPC